MVIASMITPTLVCCVSRRKGIHVVQDGFHRWRNISLSEAFS